METTLSAQSWENLTFANNFLFCKIMESEPELCRQLLELLLHIKIDHLEIPQAERTMQEWIDAKSVRFDVYTKDEEANSDFTKDIEEKVARAKVNKQWRKQYMTWQQTIDEEKEISREEGFAEGEAHGAKQTATETARRMLEDGMTAELVAKYTSLPFEEVQQLAAELVP